VELKLAAPTVSPVEKPLMEWVDQFMASRSSWKESTARSWETSRKRLWRFFATRSVQTVTPGVAADCMEFLRGTSGLSENSARKTMAHLRQVFHWLVSHEIVPRNPCMEIKTTVGVAVKQMYVPAADVLTLQPFCPNNEWRMLTVLSRFGGLRCPSEAFELRWADINWAMKRFTVHSPKTEHIPGHASRVVPLFPELRHHLDRLFHEAPSGQEYVCENLRSKSGNIYQPFRKIIMRANLQPWPRLFHNMRSSCETDLAGRFPVHLVGCWLGNSATVAAKHYLQVTEDHFKLATEEAAEPPKRFDQSKNVVDEEISE
jgi:integrase